MRVGVVAWGLLASLSTALPAQTMSLEAERLMRAAKQQGMKITPEQAERLAERQRQITGQLGALGLMQPGAAVAPSAAAASANDMSEGRLGAIVQAARRTGTGVRLDGTDDQKLVIDGRRYVDPEGELANVAADADRNVVTYLVGRGDSRTVKFAVLTDMASTMPVGRITQTRDGFGFEGRTGVRIAGDKFITLADGIGMWRDDALFLYRYGNPVASHALPEGFYPAGLQRGDVGGTGVIMLRRDQRGESGNAGAMRAAKSLLAMVGAGRKSSDVALFDTRSGKMTPLPIENFGQDEPLLDNIGQPSKSHYFWRANWMTLGQRRFAMHRAKGMQRLLVTDLDSGKSAEAFNRGLGITSWSFTPDGRGSGRLVANWMLKDHAIDDLVGWFDKAPASVEPS